MIKEIEEKVETKVKVNIYICDICGASRKTKWYNKCEMCDRHVCDKCQYIEYPPMSDYANYYCNNCWDSGDEYRKNIEILEREHDQRIKYEYKKWKDKCLVKIRDEKL